MLRVYVDGVFDLFHYGHAEMLERVHALFAPTPIYLIAGACMDEDCERYKRCPILSLDERKRSLRACRFVQEVVDGPWVITQDFLNAHQIDYVCHDSAPYSSDDMEDVYAYVKSCGMFRHVDRTQGISTTDILDRIRTHTAPS